MVKLKASAACGAMYNLKFKDKKKSFEMQILKYIKLIHIIVDSGCFDIDQNFLNVLSLGYYGRGVYFSEYPSYSMTYIRGASKLLLCQVLPGNVYRCTNLIHGEPLEIGHDSHTSPDGKELVIFNSHHILPSYVVHYGEAKGDFLYEATNT